MSGETWDARLESIDARLRKLDRHLSSKILVGALFALVIARIGEVMLLAALGLALVKR